MNTIFISDLHLSAHNKDNELRFIRLLKAYPHIDKLYILGDLFDYWIGDDLSMELFPDIIEAMANFNQPSPKIHIMHGNRDFLLGKAFYKNTSCIPLPDPTTIVLNSHTILLTHGDSLCSDDHSYQIYRKFVRNKSIQKLFFLIPTKFRKKFASSIRQRSHKKNYHKFIDANDSSLRNLVSNHQADCIIHGHTHLPSIHYFHDDKENYKTRYVLSDWHHQGHVLTHEHGNWKMYFFS